MSGVGRKLMRGAGVRVLANFAQMIVALGLTPYIVATLGEKHYGFWVLAASLLGFYGLLDLGISSGVARFTSRALGQKDEAEFRRYFTSSVYMLAVLGVVVFVATFGAAWGISSFVKDPADARSVFGLIAVMGGALAVLFPGRAFTGLLAAHLRYDLVSVMTIVTVLGRLPLVIFLFGQGYRLVGLASAIASLQLVEFAGIAFFSFRVHPGLTLARGDFSRSHARELLGYGFHTLIAQLSDLMRFKLGPVIITTIRHASMVAWFDFADKLNRIVGELVKALMSVLAPVFSEQEGRGDTAAIRRSYLFTCKIAAYMSVLLGGLMLMFGGAFLTRWVGAKYAFVIPVMQVLVLGTICSGAQMPTVQFLFGTSRHRYYARTNVVHGLLVLGLTLLLIRPYGLMGVAIGSTVPTVLMKFFVQPIHACHAMEIPLRDFYFRHAFRGLLLPIPFLVAVYFASAPFIKPEYFNVVFLAGFACLLYGPYIFFLGFTAQERARLLGAVMPRASAARPDPTPAPAQPEAPRVPEPREPVGAAAAEPGFVHPEQGAPHD